MDQFLKVFIESVTILLLLYVVFLFLFVVVVFDCKECEILAP